MNYNSEISKRLSNMGLSFEYGGYKFKTYWCRIVINESTIFNDKEHSHSFFELHLCLKGQSTFLINGKEYILKKGHYILCDRAQKHTITSMSEDFEKVVWGFDAISEVESKTINAFSTNIRETVFFDYGEEVENILNLIFLDIKNKPSGYNNTIKLKLFLLFVELLRLSMKKREIPKVLEQQKDFRMKMIDSYIDDNILQNLKVDDLVKEFNLCEKQITRICLKNRNLTIGKYIYVKKMEKAKQLLEETEESLEKISELLGYSDAYAFGKAFKRYEGLSPIKFRNSIKM